MMTVTAEALLYEIIGENKWCYTDHYKFNASFTKKVCV